MNPQASFAANSETAAAGPPLRIVLDTQVVLDWLFFQDGYAADWPMPGPHWHWLATARMRQELVWVLERPWPAALAARRDATLQAFDQLVSLQAEPSPPPPVPRCKDPSDQMFIDLALVHAPSLLISRDRAVLALAKRLGRQDVQVRRGDCHDLFTCAA